MEEVILRFRGKRAEVDELLQFLSETDHVEDAEIKEVTSIKADIFNRDPLNQFELADVIIAFTVNLASSYTFEMIRAALKKRASQKGFAEQDSVPKDDVDTK